MCHLLLSARIRSRNLRLDRTSRAVWARRNISLGLHDRPWRSSRLPHPPLMLVRVVAGPHFRGRDPDEAAASPRHGSGHRRPSTLVQFEGFGDLIADSEDGVERRHGFLENHGNALSRGMRRISSSVSPRRSVPSKRMLPETMRPGGLGDESHDGQCKEPSCRNPTRRQCRECRPR